MLGTPQKSYEDLLKENEELKRHDVYGFWTIDGRLFYAGWDTDGGSPRIRQHLENVIKGGVVGF